jgi:hypothetical protein
MTESFKKALAIIVAIVLLIIIVAYTLRLGGSKDSTYVAGTGETVVKNPGTADITATTVTGVVVEGTPFTSRSISGGGDSWLISISESQPKVFTGKLFTNTGVDNYTLFVQEENGFFAGEAKSMKDAKNVKPFTMQKTDTECKDTDGAIYEYSLEIAFNEQKLTGCGGKASSTQ